MLIFERISWLIRWTWFFPQKCGSNLEMAHTSKHCSIAGGFKFEHLLSISGSLNMYLHNLWFNILQCSSSVPRNLIYLEFGILRVWDIMKTRRFIFLHHILKHNESSLLFRFFIAQVKYWKTWRNSILIWNFRRKKDLRTSFQKKIWNQPFYELLVRKKLRIFRIIWQKLNRIWIARKINGCSNVKQMTKIWKPFSSGNMNNISLSHVKKTYEVQRACASL